MKYAPRLYACAFAAVAARVKTPAAERAAIQNFAALLQKNGDMRAHDAILAALRRAVVQESGGRMVRVETARVLSEHMRRRIRKLFKERDYVEERILPELIAGVRVVVDGEREFDGSLTKKLNTILS